VVITKYNLIETFKCLNFARIYKNMVRIEREITTKKHAENKRE